MAGGIKLNRSRRRLCLCLCLGVSYRAVGLSVDVQLDLATPTKQAKPKPTPPIPHSAQPTHTHPSVTANPSTSTTTRRYIRCLGIGTAPDPHPFSTPRGRFPHPFGAACRESADRATALVRPSSEMHAYELWEGWTDGAIRARSTRACCRIDSGSGRGKAKENNRVVLKRWLQGSSRRGEIPVYANLSIRVVVLARRSLVNMTASSSSA